MAAKAAGVGMHRLDEDEYYPKAWNPLLDEGDALRLAVKLGFLIEVIHCEQMVIVWDCGPANEERKVRVRWGDLTGAEVGDAYAATRRAIVKAAASVVKIKGDV
jgi:hypothetical protein